MQMRILVTGASGLVGSNLAAAAVQQSWSVLGTWGRAPVEIDGASTTGLDLTDRPAVRDDGDELRAGRDRARGRAGRGGRAG